MQYTRNCIYAALAQYVITVCS